MKDRTIGVVLGGMPGSGKTATMLAFKTPGKPQPQRLVIDMEASVQRYRAQDYGLTEDDPSRLLFMCDLYPLEDVITLNDFVSLWRGIKDGSIAPDVLMIDNIALLQDEMQGWAQTKEGCLALVEAAGLRQKFNTFLSYTFKVSEPQWWKLQKAVLKEFLLELRRKRIQFVGTTEMSNKWQDYGKSGKAPDGLPWQRIKGKSATLWEPWLQICDVVWNLTRLTSKNEIMTAPKIQLDSFVPKCRIVGVPPAFAFTGWDDIWAAESKREVPGTAAMATVEPPRVEIPEGATTDGDKDAEPYANWGEVLTKAREMGKTVEADKLRKSGASHMEAAKLLFA